LSQLQSIWARMKNGQGRAVWLPVLPPLGAVVELLVLVALIVALGWLIPGLDVASLEPSPYWIPVLLLSLQYGTVAGLLAAAVATGLYAFNGFPEQSIGENLFAYFLRIWASPMLWIGVAVLLGQFRLRQIEVKQDLRRQLDQRTGEATTLAMYVHQLETKCLTLERQATQGRSAADLASLGALSRLTEPEADLETALFAVVQQALPGGALSLYRVTTAGCECVARAGSGSGAEKAHDFGSAHPLYRAVTGERRSVTVLSKGDEDVLAGLGLAAVPIFAPDSGRVVGVIKLDAANPEQVTPSLPGALAVIAHLVAPFLIEPRIVVDNSAREAPEADGIGNELREREWRRYPWRDKPGVEDKAHASLSPVAGIERSNRPKRRT
jgi:hypothetical protein